MSDPHAAHDPGLDQEDPDAGSTWTWFIAGSVIFAALAIGVAALYYDMSARHVDEIRTSAPISTVERLDQEQEARLTSPARRERRADSPDGAIVIPVADAARLMLEEAGS
jgi:hypothetical protein